MSDGLFELIGEPTPTSEKASVPAADVPRGLLAHLPEQDRPQTITVPVVVASTTTPRLDLFAWLDALWNKQVPEGTPPVRMMHRFLASDRDLAPYCRVLSVEVREAPLIFHVWQGLLPRGPRAPTNPRLSYVAAKKPPQEEALVTRMREVLLERRTVVEQMVALVKAAGLGPLNELYAYFGVEAYDATNDEPF